MAVAKLAAFDFQSIELNVDDAIILGHRGTSFEHGFECEKLFGAAREALGRTIGVYNVEDFELTLYEATYAELVAKLGQGYMRKEFPMTETLTHPEAQDLVFEFQDCRIVKDAHDWQQGAEGLECSITISVMKVLINGVDPAAEP